MPERITLLGKTFEIFCPTHPNEYHDTILFKKNDDKQAMLCLEIRFDANELINYLWEIPIDSLTDFEKKLNKTGTATIEEGENMMAMKLENGKIFYRIKIINKLFTDTSYGFTFNYWLEIRER